MMPVTDSSDAPTPLFDTLVVIGPGLIGASVLHRARRDRTIARRLIAVDINPAFRERVRELGIADEVTGDAAAAVADADCVMLCVPVGAMGEVAATVIPAMKPGAILTDTGSTKVAVIEAIRPFLRPDVPYVPAHPMAGTEYSGPDAGFATLFDNRWCLLTPLPDNAPDSVEAITTLWQLCGARTRDMTPEHHDRVCAIVSHLPICWPSPSAARLTIWLMKPAPKCWNLQPAASGISRESRHLIPSCGGTSFCPIVKPFLRCFHGFWRMLRRWPVRSAGAIPIISWTVLSADAASDAVCWKTVRPERHHCPV